MALTPGLSGGSELSGQATAAVCLRLPARPESVGRARHVLADLAARHGVDPQDVALAVSEAVSNVVLHAYRDDTPEPVEAEVAVHAAPEPECLRVSISDGGVGMGPNPDSPGLGLGLPLIGRVAEELEIDSEPDGGTRLLMRFRRAGTSQIASV